MSIKKSVFLIGLIVAAVGLVILFYQDKPTDEMFEKGVLDLSKTNFKQDKIIALNGDWEFYWQELVAPDNKIGYERSSAYVSVPGNWETDIDNKKYPSEGYATYRMILKNVPNYKYYSLKKYVIRDNYVIYINGDKLFQNGKVSDSVDSFDIKSFPEMRHFEVTSGEIEIIIHVANDTYMDGGLVNSIVFGEQSTMIKYFDKKRSLELIVITALFTIALVYLVFYIFNPILRHEIPATIYFSMSCLTLMFYNALKGERVIGLIMPDMPMDTVIGLMFISGFSILISSIIFIYKIENKFLSKKLKNIFLSVYLIAILITLIQMKYHHFWMLRSLLSLSSLVFLVIFIRVLYFFVRNEHFKCGESTHMLVITVLFFHNIYFISSTLRSVSQWQSLSMNYFILIIYVCVLAILLSFLYYKVDLKLVNTKINLLKSNTELENKSEEAKNNEVAFLLAQIKPHFIFNTLSTVASLIKYDPDKCYDVVLSLSEYLRYSFDLNIGEEMVLLEEELRLIKIYLDIEKARFSERFEFVLKCDEIPSVLVPRLSIQPLIENALRHGILKKTKIGTITLSINELEEGIMVMVTDNGIGMSESKMSELVKSSDNITGVGVKNINARLSRHYDQTLTIMSQENIETSFSFIVPKILKEANEVVSEEPMMVRRKND